MCCGATDDEDFRTKSSRCSYPGYRTLQWTIVRVSPPPTLSSIRHHRRSKSSLSILSCFKCHSSSHLSSSWSSSACRRIVPFFGYRRQNTDRICFSHFFTGCSSSATFFYLLLSCLILLLPSMSMASPVRSLDRVDRSVSDKPNWIDPCSLGAIDKVMNPSEEFKASVPKLDEKDLFQKIYSRSEVAKDHSNKVKRDFVLSIFKDESFEEDTVHMTYDWLPTLPEPSLEHLHQLKRDVAFRKSFEYLQFYAVGLEQVRIDQVLHSGEFLNDIADMEAKLRQVLCELQISMLSLRVDQNPDITRRVMSTKLRDMNSQTTRDFRDYIIIREYAKGMNYVQQVFGFFIAKLS